MTTTRQDPQSTYAILGRMAGDGPLVAACDRALAQINADALAHPLPSLCGVDTDGAPCGLQQGHEVTAGTSHRSYLSGPPSAADQARVAVRLAEFYAAQDAEGHQ